MTYSNDLKIKIIDCIKLKKYTDTEIINIFNISVPTFYKIKKEMNVRFKYNSKRVTRKTKITNVTRTYIINYVLRKINFSYTRLIQLVKNKFNIIVSKSTIYNIL